MSSGGKHKPSHQRVYITQRELLTTYTDLWGPSKVPSNGGDNYMLTIIDDFSRRVWSFFLKHMRDVFATSNK